MFVLTGSFDLITDAEGWVQLPAWVAAELRRTPFVIEPALDAHGRRVLMGLPLAAAPHIPPACVDSRGRILLPDYAPKYREAEVVRFIGRGQYFVIAP